MADYKIKNRLVVSGSEVVINGEQATTTANTQTLTNKSISGSTNTLTNIPSSALSSGVDASKIADGSVSNAEFQYLDGVTSSIQTQLNGKALDSVVIKKDGSVAYTAAQSMGGNKLTSLAAGTVSSDAVNKGQLDAALEGLKPKAAVRVATTANITIATALNSGDVIDGITLANGDRVLVKDQTAAEANGIYVVSATPTRSTDFDQLSPIDEINGSLVAVQEGTVNAGKVYVQSGAVVVLDTDAINFVFFNSSASLIGGDGITVSGSNISVDHDGNGLTFSAGQLILELDGSTLAKGAAGLKLNDTAVTAASYGSVSQVGTFTVDAQGRLTAAANASIAITSAAVTDFNEAAQDAVGATLTDSATIDLTYDDSANTISAIVIDASITDAKIATGIDAAKIGAGTVSNTEFGYLDGVTSAIQTQLTAKANQSLNNLTTTSINQALLPDGDTTRNLGSAVLNWGTVFANNVSTLSNVSASGLVRAGDDRIRIVGNDTVPTSESANLLQSNQAGQGLGVVTANNATVNASSTGNVYVESGNKTAGTGNSGDIKIATGTSAGGTRGVVILDGSSINASSKQIKALADPTLAQDAATKNYVDTAVSGASYTNEQAQDAVGNILTDSSKIDFTYDDTANTITATIVPASLVNADINASAAIALTKLAATTVNRALVSDGSGFVSPSAVTATELGYVSGVTSSIQTQLNGKVSAVTGDIAPTSFSTANNQAAAADVTGLAFANATTRSFKVLMDIQIDATSDLYEVYELLGVQKGASWDMSQSSTGDDAGLVFTITNAGQIQYTSTNVAGFVSGSLKFRASTIPVA